MEGNRRKEDQEVIWSRSRLGNIILTEGEELLENYEAES